MYDLDRQLSEFASFVDDAVAPIQVGEAMERPKRSYTRSRRVGISIVFATFVAMAIGLVVLIAPLGTEDGNVADRMPPATTEGLEVAPTPDANSLTWTRVDDADLGGDGVQMIHSLRSTSIGLIAVGEDDHRPAIWISAEGTDWSRIDVSPSESPYGDESVLWINDVADNGSRLVAVGIDQRGSSESWSVEGTGSVAFWYSDDGYTWTRAPHNGEAFEVEGGWSREMIRIVATPGGFVAVGDSIWISVDGITWTRRESPGDWQSDLAVTADGMILVGAGQSIAWTSADGVNWIESEIQPPVGPDGGGLTAITPFSGGFLASGGDDSALAWFSVDGQSWELRGGVDGFDNFAYNSQSDIAALTDHVLIVGMRYPMFGTGVATIWQSEDGGYTWNVFDDPEHIMGIAYSEVYHSSAFAVAAFEGRFLVAGYRADDASVWIGTLEDS